MQKTATIDYGFIKKNENSCKWQFWSKKDDGSDIELEIQKDFNNVTLLKGNFKDWENPEQYKSVLDVLEIDWLYKALPHPILYIKPPILKYLLLKKITNPVLLAAALLGNHTNKITPRMYFKHILQNPYFDSWAKLKRALLILLVCDNNMEALANMPELLEKLKNDIHFSSLIYSAFCEQFLVSINLSESKLNLYIDLLASKNSYYEGDDRDIDLINLFGSKFENISNWVPINNFVKADLLPVDYEGSLQLPNGFELLTTEEQLIKESKKMNHCVARFRYQHHFKEVFYFHVSYPEMATLEIKKQETSGEFIITEIRGIKNAEVSDSLLYKANMFVSSKEAQAFFKTNYVSFEDYDVDTFFTAE
ncbi:MAG: hypothetical protein JEZ09_15395 [Salinivirgaceae bacterium]|nr:hypothetical protein [Salinivirgaceae bacterium]